MRRKGLNHLFIVSPLVLNTKAGSRAFFACHPRTSKAQIWEFYSFFILLGQAKRRSENVILFLSPSDKQSADPRMLYFFCHPRAWPEDLIINARFSGLCPRMTRWCEDPRVKRESLHSSGLCQRTLDTSDDSRRARGFSRKGKFIPKFSICNTPFI